MQFKSTGAKILTHCVIGMIGHKHCSHHHDHDNGLVTNIVVIMSTVASINDAININIKLPI